MVNIYQVQLDEVLGTAIVVDGLSIKGNKYWLLMVKLLRLQTHNQKDLSDFQSKKMGAPAGDLD